MAFIIVATSLLVMPFLESPYSYIFDSIFVILTVVVITLDVIATVIDPEDKHKYKSVSHVCQALHLQ